MARVHVRIGTKLIFLVSAMLLGTVPAVAYLTASPFLKENTALIREMNSESVARISERLRNRVRSLTDQMRRVAFAMAGGPSSGSARPEMELSDLLALSLYARDPGGGISLRQDESLNEVRVFARSVLERSADFRISDLFRGDEQMSLIKLRDGGFLIAIGVPMRTAADADQREFSRALVGLALPGYFGEALQNDENLTSFLVDRNGVVLASSAAQALSDDAFAVGTDLSGWGGIRLFLDGKLGNGQNRYVDPATGQVKLSAFRRLGFGGLAVVSVVPENRAFAASRRVMLHVGLLVIAVLSMAFLVAYLFSDSITYPISLLLDATRRIQRGDFAVELGVRGQDEISALSSAFNGMARGLEERDRVKDLFGKFHSKAVLDHLLSKQARLGGERKQAIMLFLDLRGFTAMSESLEPEQVVEMLNEFFTRMVSIIRLYHGIVDKFVGDAIVAVWGVPLGQPNDAKNAVSACLAMRREMERLNQLRVSRGQQPLTIGMGLNAGMVVAGNIGSNERMEYTVIGDAVNIASRVEALTKEHDTDLLITRSVRDLVLDQFQMRPCAAAQVRGKQNVVELFKVV